MSDPLTVRRVVLDHITVGVSDLERSRAFYRQLLAPLGFVEHQPEGGSAAEVEFGTPDFADFAISTKYDQVGTTHVAFLAEDRDQVAAFHAAGLAAGGTDNGAPGPRPEYSAGYYGAFILDPDGHNVEAVFHDR